MAVSGLTDRNRDGLDDDGAMTIRVLDNRATVTLHRNRTYAVADAGFVFTNSRSVLKESAQAVDRILRLVASAPHGADAWDLAAIRGLGTRPPRACGWSRTSTATTTGMTTTVG